MFQGFANDGLDRAEDRPFDRVIDGLKHVYRRRMLVALLESNTQHVTDLDDPIEAVHTHLPKLERLGYIALDNAGKTFSKGKRWSEIQPVVELLDGRKEDLPDGWL